MQSILRIVYTLDSMKALILETSTEKSCLILANDGKPEKWRSLPGGPELSKTLAAEAKALLADSSPPDFIAAGQGPGSYTGTRVGAALAKGLSFGWNIPLYGFCSLSAFIPAEENPFAVIVDAKMGGFYLLLGEKDIYEKPLLVKEANILPLLENIPLIASPHPSLISARLPSLSLVEAFPNIELLSKQVFFSKNKAPLELTYLSSP